MERRRASGEYDGIIPIPSVHPPIAFSDLIILVSCSHSVRLTKPRFRLDKSGQPTCYKSGQIMCY